MLGEVPNRRGGAVFEALPAHACARPLRMKLIDRSRRVRIQRTVKASLKPWPCALTGFLISFWVGVVHLLPSLFLSDLVLSEQCRKRTSRVLCRQAFKRGFFYGMRD